jgi:hypothetical protein
VPGGSFQTFGTVSVLGTFTGGTVTQISRGSAGTDFQVVIGNSVDAGLTAAVGQILVDTTVSGSSACVIDSLAGSGATLTATCSSPQNLTTITTVANNFNPTTASNGASWTSGDTLQLETVSTIYADVWAPQAGLVALNDAGASIATSGLSWTQYLDFGDPGGGKGTVTIAPRGQWAMVLCTSHAYASVLGDPAASGTNLALPQVVQDSFLNGAGFTGSLSVIAGSVGALTASFNVSSTQMQFRSDVILHGTSAGAIQNGWVQAFNLHLTGGTVAVEPGAAVVLRAGIANGSLWGGSTVRFYEGATGLNRTGGTFANNLLMNALQLGQAGSTTGCVPLDGGAGAPACGKSVTSANLDTFGGLTDQYGAARIVN